MSSNATTTCASERVHAPSNTIVWTKGRDPYPRLRDTVLATVRAIGRGQITVGHVVWAINAQLRGHNARYHVTAAQVRRVLNTLTHCWRDFRANGHGVYRWR